MVAFRAVDISVVEKSAIKKIKYYSGKHYSPQESVYVFSTLETVVNEFGESIIKVTGNIPQNLPVKKGDSFLFISSDQAKYLHSIHRYPAKFFPELPRWLIERYSNPGDTILDPFAGSGTTNLEALLLGRNSVAVDIEKFCHKLIQVKTTPINPNVLEQSNQELLRRMTSYDPILISPNDIPEFNYRDKWFEDYILYELAFIKKTISQMSVTPQIRDFYTVCFSSVVRGVSNADDGCTRTVVRKKMQKDIYPSMAIIRFIETILVNTFKMKEFFRVIDGATCACQVLDNSDAKFIGIDSSTMDCAITSPPYVNAVDYPRTHQLELYWLGLEEGSLTPLKKRHIGTEAVSYEQYSRCHKIGIAEIDSVIERLFIVDKRRSYIAFKYLVDMSQNFREVFRVLKPGKRYIVVVGNNRIRGTVFESWKYLSMIAETIGFEIETWFSSEVIKHFIKVPREERIDQDFIIVLRKPSDDIYSS